MRHGFVPAPKTMLDARGLLAQAAIAGGNVRIGLKDATWIARGVKVPSNAAMVEKACRMLDDPGVERMGPGAPARHWVFERTTHMLTLFHSPGSCSNGILYLLNDLDLPHRVHVVDILKGDQRQPDYRALNPKGKVPALRLEDGTVLTEFPVIAFWIAQSGAWPGDPLAQARTLELLDFMVASVHMRGFTFVKVPGKFVSDPDAQAALYAHGRDQVDQGLAILSETLGDKDYLQGDFTIADAALIYLLDWAEMDGIAIADNLAACHARLRARPAYAASAAHWTR
ncbi:Glutathione S-transferase GST-6.0 [Marinibacterium anthonyi]|nr:Glutathione S-transferase GST-6.0 [Marinibacterium anthonyi]